MSQPAGAAITVPQIEKALLEDVALASPFRIAVNSGESFRVSADAKETDLSSWSYRSDEEMKTLWANVLAESNLGWMQAFKYMPAVVDEKQQNAVARTVGKLLNKRPPTSLYQTGGLIVAITTTLAFSRPAVGAHGAGMPLKPPVQITHVHAAPATAAIEMRGEGRDTYGVLPADALEDIDVPRAHTIDDWDF